MKLLHFLVLSAVLVLCSCAHTPSASGPVSITQLKTLDLVTIRPRLILWLGTDSTGLDAISMINTYEEFLFSLNTTEAIPKVPSEPPLPTSDANLVQLNQQNVIYPPPKNILDENLAASPFIQLARQRLREWIEQLNNSYLEYYNTLDLRLAKKGAAAGYNALLSGPTLSDIPKISDKMKSLLDSLYAHCKQ
jgi:hypothetical protein